MPSTFDIEADSLLMLLTVAIAISFTVWAFSCSRSAASNKKHQEAAQQVKLDNVYLDIVPLDQFDWSQTAPIRLRPFKPRYNLTMSTAINAQHVQRLICLGIALSEISELVEMDETYMDRIKLRRRLVQTDTDSVIACNQIATAAVLELHQWIFSIYLPRRFPRLFDLTGTTHPLLKNHITGETTPIKQTDPLTALRDLNAHVDTDFIILLPSSNSIDGQPRYHEEAFIATFPNGFSFKDKLSLPLATIHQPVPGYAAKLERSMDRYFAKLAVGTVVKRANWSVTTHSRLFAISGNHFYKEDDSMHGEQTETEAETRRQAYQHKIDQLRNDFSLDDCRLRCERQTLHRLPKSGAIVFGIKTYQYTLQEVRASGDGPALADAIDGLGKGNVPDMLYYKRGIIWGDRVAEYLRSSTS